MLHCFLAAAIIAQAIRYGLMLENEGSYKQSKEKNSVYFSSSDRVL